MTTLDSTSARQQILDRMQVPGLPYLYVLGCLESRITLYTQQVRALNLIYALNDKLKKGDATVAVIGAGAGGLMAAAAAGACGYRVSVFEKNPNPLDLIGPSRLRWLHPHIYEWPHNGAENSRAGLPFLDWTEGLAHNVVFDQLHPQWADLVKAYHIEVHPSVRDLGIDPGAGGPHMLRWNGGGPNTPYNNPRHPSGQVMWGNREGSRMRIQPFDVVILAVGFGKERRSDRFPDVIPYWEGDNIDRDDRLTKSPVSRVLISGTGDGGLIDLLRYSFRDFRHEIILSEFQNKWLRHPDISAVKARVIEIEEDAWARQRTNQPYLADLNLSYRELADSLVLDEVPFRKQIQPVLTGMKAYPLDLDSAPLNRFLFSLTNAEYVPGPTVSALSEGDRKGYKVTFNDGKVRDFDDVVIRHGPAPALERYFPEIWERCKDLRKVARTTPDPTRQPLDYGRFYEERLALRGELLRPGPPAQPDEEFEQTLPAVAPAAESGPAAVVGRYRKTLIDTIQQSEDG